MRAPGLPRRVAADLLMLLSVAGLAAGPFWLAGCEPWRPLSEALGRAADACGIPAPRVNNRGQAEDAQAQEGP